jgi:hypothetical protein
VQAVHNSLCRQDTGLIAHPVFLYLLQNEFYRYESLELPFTVVIFGYCDKSKQTSAADPPHFIPLKTRAIIELRDKVSATKKKYDQLCHYGTFAYALLLPLTTKENAARYIEMVAESLANLEVGEAHERPSLEFRAGIANIPEDCLNLDQMLELAESVKSLDGSYT